MAKIEIMETNQKIGSTGGDNNIYLDPEFISQFPIKNEYGLKIVEDHLMNEPEYTQKLVFIIH